MKKITLWVVALLTLFPGMLRAQDIGGSWQGTLDGPKLRVVMQITKADDGAWKAMLYSIDQGTDGMAANTFSLTGTTVKFSIDAIHGSYEGTLGADGNTIAGAWTQGGKPMPLTLVRATKEAAWAIDSSPHKVQFVTVDKDVKLEVLDWGGTGRPLIFLTGLGNNAHIYDKFAPKFTSGWHVYGITRRGFGVSSAPAPADGNYAADRLGDDVLAVMDALKLERPVLVGHSIAGEELSSIGSRHPERVAGLIYLDAGMAYAFYDPALGDIRLDGMDMRDRLNQLLTGAVVPDKQFIAELQSSATLFEKDLAEMKKDAEIMPLSAGHGPPPAIRMAIISGEQRYTKIPVPVLAVYAVPHKLDQMFDNPPLKDNPTAQTALKASDLAHTTARANSFEAGVPTAHVVRMANADHYVFLSNEADVLREMNAFLATLPKR